MKDLDLYVIQFYVVIVFHLVKQSAKPLGFLFILKLCESLYVFLLCLWICFLSVTATCGVPESLRGISAIWQWHLNNLQHVQYCWLSSGGGKQYFTECTLIMGMSGIYGIIA